MNFLTERTKTYVRLLLLFTSLFHLLCSTVDVRPSRSADDIDFTGHSTATTVTSTISTATSCAITHQSLVAAISNTSIMFIIDCCDFF